MLAELNALTLARIFYALILSQLLVSCTLHPTCLQETKIGFPVPSRATPHGRYQMMTSTDESGWRPLQTLKFLEENESSQPVWMWLYEPVEVCEVCMCVGACL